MQAVDTFKKNNSNRPVLEMNMDYGKTSKAPGKTSSKYENLRFGENKILRFKETVPNL